MHILRAYPIIRSWLTIFILLLAFGFQSAAAHGAQLWRGTETGMSVDDVLAVVHGAKIVEPTSSLVNGAIAQVTLESYELTGEEFEIYFYFLESKLDQVTINLKQPHSAIDNRSVYGKLIPILRSKYGEEIYTEENVFGDGGSESRSINWMHGPTNITLYSSIWSDSWKPDELNTLRVIYQTRISVEAEKL